VTDDSTERGDLEGVEELEHTADVGLRVEASSVEQLFHRAAAGTVRLVQGDPSDRGDHGTGAREGAGSQGGGSELRSVEIRLPDEAGVDGPKARAGSAAAFERLLAHWLREVLYLLEAERFLYGGATFDRLEPDHLEATVRGNDSAPPGVREIKGVTYHGLAVRRTGDRWTAQVVFDL